MARKAREAGPPRFRTVEYVRDRVADRRGGGRRIPPGRQGREAARRRHAEAKAGRTEAREAPYRDVIDCVAAVFPAAAAVIVAEPVTASR